MIPLVDIKAQYAAIQPELEAAVLAVLRSGQYAMGSEVAAFETEFSSHVGGGEVIGVNSGTSALHLAFLAAGIGPGDEVITTPMTFVATVSAIDYAGATPVFVDIDPKTWTLDPARIEAAITPRTKAIAPVHLHGRMADMDGIMAVARAHGLLVIEDAAQAHGAEHGGRRAGAFGDIACFSFYPGKNLGAVGEAGAAVTSNGEYARKMRALRDWGMEEKYVHLLKGYNYRMENLQGAALRVKLKRLEAWTDARRTAACRYHARLDALGLDRPTNEGTGERHAFHIYASFVPDFASAPEAVRDGILTSLREAGVGAGMHYPIPVHLQPCFRALGYREGAFPIAERFGRTQFSLPLFPEITEEQIDAVCEALAVATGRQGLKR